MSIDLIFVCDDNTDFAADWQTQIDEAIGGATTVRRIEDAKSEFRKLLARIPRDDADGPAGEERTDFDEADVLVVDYDLIEVDAESARHTGEGFARMARLYSDCGFIIVMNQFAEKATFDLEMAGHLESFADLNVDSSVIGFPTLWGGERDGKTFAPWIWPNISDVIAKRAKLIDLIKGDFSQRLLEVLEFPEKHIGALSDKAIGFLSTQAADATAIAEVTVREFLELSTEHKELARAITSSPRRAAAAAVARLSKWYSRAVLGPQDVLVDVPHLLQRMPFVLRKDFGDPLEMNTWNNAIAAGASALINELEPARFSGCDGWIGKDAFWWPDIVELEVVRTLRSQYNPSDFADFVFAEDASVFVSFEDAKAFRAGFHNQFDVRYIKSFRPGISYGPSRRLASV